MTDVNYIPVQMQYNMENPNDKLYLEFKPAENLRRYICCYWVSPLFKDMSIDGRILPKKEIVMPDGCIDVLFGIDKNGNSCRNILVGTMSKGCIIGMEHDNLKTFGVRFYPGGLQAFLKESSKSFTDKMESIEELDDDIFIKLKIELSKIESVYDKINYANRYFTSIMRVAVPLDNEFQNVLYHIYQSKGLIKIKEIIDREVISEKKLRRIFYNRVGINTKAFIKIIRLQNAIGIINLNKSTKIVDVALDSGYYDESHFIHDFYDLAGLNPSEYLKCMIKE